MLSNIIGKYKFKSPILTASGTYGYGDEVKDLVDINNLGGIITKSVTLHPREGNPPPRISETNSGMLNSIGLANLGVKEYIKQKLPVLDQLNTNVIINIAGSKLEDYLETLEMLESTNSNHIGYEINISCPNVKEGGMEFGVNPRVTEELTSKMRTLTDRLLVMKLSPNVTSISEIALAAENGGADAISAINTVVGMGVDIDTFKSKLYTTFGGLSGPAIKPIALAHVHKIYKAVNIPIIGMGGISCAKDVIEFILCGADLVQIGTLNYKNPNLGVEILTDLREFCNDKGIAQLSDLKGKIEYHNE